MRLTAASKTSARRESSIAIWPALRKTFVLPNCMTHSNYVKYCNRYRRTLGKIQMHIVKFQAEHNKPDNSQAPVSQVFFQ